MKSVMAIVLIGIFVFVFDSFVAYANQSDLSVSYSCRESSNTCWLTGYRPVPGDTLELWIRILNRFDHQNRPNHQSSSLTVTLFNRSNYTGDYINSASSSRGFDMGFQSLAEHGRNNESRLRWEHGSYHLYSDSRSFSESLTVRWDNLPPPTIKIYIDISDGAAYGQFRAALYNKPSWGMTIPYDVSPQNGIADSFDRRYSDADRRGLYGDNERGPGSNPHHGDGLNYWEEYRGARLKGTWRALDPRKKEYFIYSDFDGPPPNLGGAGTKGYVERNVLKPLIIDAKASGFAGNLFNKHRDVFTGYVVNESETRNRAINFRRTFDSRTNLRYVWLKRITQEAIAIEERPFADIRRARAWIRSEYNFPKGSAVI